MSREQEKGLRRFVTVLFVVMLALLSFTLRYADEIDSWPAPVAQKCAK